MAGFPSITLCSKLIILMDAVTFNLIINSLPNPPPKSKVKRGMIKRGSLYCFYNNKLKLLMIDWFRFVFLLWKVDATETYWVKKLITSDELTMVCQFFALVVMWLRRDTFTLEVPRWLYDYFSLGVFIIH